MLAEVEEQLAAARRDKAATESAAAEHQREADRAGAASKQDLADCQRNSTDAAARAETAQRRLAELEEQLAAAQRDKAAKPAEAAPSRSMTYSEQFSMHPRKVMNTAEKPASKQQFQHARAQLQAQLYGTVPPLPPTQQP